MIKLKPCPFCGEKATLGENYEHRFSVFCLSCGAEVNARFNNEQEAAKAWNHRGKIKTKSQIGKMSKNKGAGGELELAKALTQHGYPCRRSRQYCGSESSADILGLPGVHAEVKRVERFNSTNLYDALAQAKADTGASGDMPVVFHRRNDHEWVAVLTLDNFMELYREWESGMADIKIGGSE